MVVVYVVVMVAAILVNCVFECMYLDRYIFLTEVAWKSLRVFSIVCQEIEEGRLIEC